MNDPDSPNARERHGHLPFRDSVHGGGNHRNAQLDLPGQPCRKVNLSRLEFASSRQEDEITEGVHVGSPLELRERALWQGCPCRWLSVVVG